MIILTEKFFNQIYWSEDELLFCKQNNIFGISLDEIKQFDNKDNFPELFDWLHELTLIEYGSDGNVIHIRSNDGYFVKYEYNAIGYVIKQTDSNGYITWEYDSVGNVIGGGVKYE